MNLPWTQTQIDEARIVPFSLLLDHLGAYYKVDSHYVSLDPSRGSRRVNIAFHGRDFRLIVTGQKFVNELLPEASPNRGGGGCIDFARHITGCNFVVAVKICLDALCEARKK